MQKLTLILDWSNVDHILIALNTERDSCMASLPRLQELAILARDPWDAPDPDSDSFSLLIECVKKRKGKLKRLILPVLPNGNTLASLQSAVDIIEVRHPPPLYPQAPRSYFLLIRWESVISMRTRVSGEQNTMIIN